MGFGILGCKRFSPAVRVSLMKVLWRVAAWDGGRGRGAFARQEQRKAKRISKAAKDTTKEILSFARVS